MGIPHCDDALAFATTGHIGPSVKPWVVWRLRNQGDRFTAGRDVSTEKITKSTRRKWFWTFVKMCNEVCAPMVRLTYWIESCACHSHLIKATVRGRYEKHQRAIMFRNLLAKRVVATGEAFMWDYCPMGGKHAAELACGAAKDLLEELFVRGLGVVLSMCNGLAADEIQSISMSFTQARCTPTRR